MIISIHTPARGVTIWERANHSQPSISIHTPARGVTTQQSKVCSSPINFNPHSRKGSDD